MADERLLNKTAVDVAVLITYIDPKDAKNPISLLLDTVEATGINSSSTITQHPTVFGTPMADHMYRNPITVTLNGTFSLNGKKGIVIEHGHGSLRRVEEMFEELKNKGVDCTITKITTDNRDSAQFAIRTHMVLQSIHWTEHVNTVDFSFNFQEVLVADVVEADVDPDDRFAPNINYAKAANFSDTLLDWDMVDELVIKQLWDFELIAKEFLELLGTMTAGALIGLAIGTAVAVALANTLLALGVAASAIPVVGAVVAAVIAIVAGFIAIIKWVKKTGYRIKAFKYYRNAKKQKKEIKRFADFYESIHNKIRSLDGVVRVYTINDNEPQETILSIGGNYYVFNFEKHNTSKNVDDYAYSLKITDINDNVMANVNTNYAIESFMDGTPDNSIVKANATGGNYVYLIYSPEGKAKATAIEESNTTSSDSNAELQDSITDDRTDLRNYMICVSSMNPEDFTKALKDIIVAALKY